MRMSHGMSIMRDRMVTSVFARAARKRAPARTVLVRRPGHPGVCPASLHADVRFAAGPRRIEEWYPELGWISWR